MIDEHLSLFANPFVLNCVVGMLTFLFSLWLLVVTGLEYFSGKVCMDVCSLHNVTSIMLLKDIK